MNRAKLAFGGWAGWIGFAMLTGAPLGTPAFGGSTSFPRTGSSCAEQIEALAKSWGSKGAWASLGKNHYTRTSSPEKWVELSRISDKGFQLSLLRPHGERLLAYFPEKTCEKQVSQVAPMEKKRRPKKFQSFDDRALARLAFEKKNVFFYAWSPHMVVSVLHYRDALDAARRNSVEILPLLDPMADEYGAELMAAQYGIDPKQIRILDSETLKEEGIFLHYPSYALMKGGNLAPAVIAGARASMQEYDELIKKFLRL